MLTMTRRIVIRSDSDSMSPRECDNVGTMVCWHRRYTLGDEQPKVSDREWLLKLADELVGGFKTDIENVSDANIVRVLDKYVCASLPLYLYDHSGITMNTTGFACRWDSGRVGWIYVTWELARRKWTGSDDEIRAAAIACLLSEVKVYDQYISNEVYRFVVEQYDQDDGVWVEVDACGGFYGSDPRENGMLEHWDEETRAHFEQCGVVNEI